MGRAVDLRAGVLMGIAFAGSLVRGLIARNVRVVTAGVAAVPACSRPMADASTPDSFRRFADLVLICRSTR